jgi:prepilin-type N-terminal cleavage/methylation domain-containing protein
MGVYRPQVLVIACRTPRAAHATHVTRQVDPADPSAGRTSATPRGSIRGNTYISGRVMSTYWPMRVECDRPPVARTWVPFAARTRRHAPGSDGFTLIELVIALSLSAILFAGLAAIMGTSLRTLSVTRSRGQANEIAAQGIEDLQRFSFSSLVLCNTPTVPPGGTVPSGFTAANTVLAVSCANATLESPCPAPATTGLTGFPVPTANYTCTRYGINFAVSRYISWADATLTNKRLAVVVDWTDQVGRHEVSQQSSVRAPDQDAIIGGTPPSLTSVSTAPMTVWVNSSGFLVTSTGTPQSIALVANATGLLATDKVSAYFLTEDPVSHVLTTATLPLTSADGSTWTGSIPGSGASGAPTFPTAGGSQYIGFTGIRQSDGKANSILSVPAITFCNNPSAGNGAGTCTINAGAPTIPAVAVNPTSVPLNPDGTLFVTATLTVTATTTNLYASTTASDSVIAVVETLAGASQVVLKPTCPLNGTLSVCNTWKVTIDSTMALRFAAGPQKIAVIANQVASAPYSTASALSGTVTFS